MTGAEATAILAALAIGATVKALTGMGMPLVAIPIGALFVGVEAAVVIVALPNLVSNAMLMGEHRGGWAETGFLPLMVGCGIVGAVFGTWLLATLDERVLMLALAVIVGGYLLIAIRDPSFEWSPTVARRGTPIVGFAGGVFQGAAGISGPILASWTHGLRLSKSAFVFTITTMFGITGLVQAVTLTALGLWDADRLAVAAVGVVLVAVLTPVAMRAGRRLSGAWFDRLVLGVLALSAVSLIVRVVA